MACIITYNDKKYTQSEFNEYFKSHFFEFAGDFIGSKQDIEQFKNWIKNHSNNSNSSKLLSKIKTLNLNEKENKLFIDFISSENTVSKVMSLTDTELKEYYNLVKPFLC